MCGIVGFVTNEFRRGVADREKFFRQALIMDTLRGEDSTGIFGVGHKYKKHQSADWLKNAVDGYTFVADPAYNKFMQDDFRFLVGHNRAATVGSVVTDNAHPFQEGPITLVHNGSLWGTSRLPISMRQLPKVQVDSHVLCHNLAEHDVKDVIENIDGAFTLVWHDARDNSLNVCRNDERPFHMTQIIGEDTILFMSEAEMLHTLTKRLKMNTGAIYHPKPGQWLKFRAKDVLNPVLTEVKAKKYDWQGYSNGLHNWADRLQWNEDTGEWKERPNKEPPTPSLPKTEDNRVLVGGRMREVPLQLQLSLLKHELEVEDRLTFIPTNISMPPGRIAGIASGYVTDSNMSCVIYNVSEALFEVAKNRSWTVRPVGIANMGDTGEPTIIGKTVSTRGATLPPMKEDNKVSTLFVKGPGSVHIPYREFMELVNDGCYYCGSAIYGCDAETIEWVNNETKPICSDCVNIASIDIPTTQEVVH